MEQEVGEESGGWLRARPGSAHITLLIFYQLYCSQNLSKEKLKNVDYFCAQEEKKAGCGEQVAISGTSDMHKKSDRMLWNAESFL